MHAPQDRPRNPFRNEADAFRVLVMFVAAAAIVVAATLLLGPTVGLVAAVILLIVGSYRSWGLWQSWAESGSDPSGTAQGRDESE